MCLFCDKQVPYENDKNKQEDDKGEVQIHTKARKWKTEKEGFFWHLDLGNTQHCN